MITGQSPPAQIRRELEQDEPRAHYWFMKQHHGQRGYDKWRDEMCMRLLDSPHKKELFSDPVPYRSSNGNRWLAYEHISRDGTGGFFAYNYCACYRETAGSVEAIVKCDTSPTADPDGPTMPGCIIFTNHFFQRFAERLGLEMGSRRMMLRFLQLAHTHLIMEREPRPGCRDIEIAMRYPASYALGTRRDVDGFRVVTVRTFLPVTMLNPARRKQLEEFGLLSDQIQTNLERQRNKERAATQVELPIYE